MSIANCCVLPFGWNPEDILMRYESKPHNPRIANAFYRAGYIEAWGRGIQKISYTCIAIGAKEPVNKIHGEDIMLTFRSIDSLGKNITQTTQTTTQAPLDEKILQTINLHPEWSQKQMAEALDVGVYIIKYYIRKLKDKDRRERIGSSQKGYWKIK